MRPCECRDRCGDDPGLSGPNPVALPCSLRVDALAVVAIDADADSPCTARLTLSRPVNDDDLLRILAAVENGLKPKEPA